MGKRKNVGGTKVRFEMRTGANTRFWIKVVITTPPDSPKIQVSLFLMVLAVILTFRIYIERVL
jgi:hypothetical protein